MGKNYQPIDQDEPNRLKDNVGCEGLGHEEYFHDDEVIKKQQRHYRSFTLSSNKGLRLRGPQRSLKVPNPRPNPLSGFDALMLVALGIGVVWRFTIREHTISTFFG